MLVLVVSDVHLKPAVFDRAEKILESGQAERAVLLGDFVDDWGEEFNIGLYGRTMKRLLEFLEQHPDTLLCLGNHDMGYYYPEYGRRETGHSKFQEGEMAAYLRELDRRGFKQEVCHVVDKCIFSHAGVSKEWLNRRAAKSKLVGEDLSITFLPSVVNTASNEELWEQDSPIWWRSINDWDRLTDEAFGAGDYLHVVGHTPVKEVVMVDNILYTDVFSTYSNGAPIGNRKFAIVDTEKMDWRYADE